MTVNELLDKISVEEQFVDFEDVLFYYKNRDTNSDIVRNIIIKTVKAWCQQCLQ